MDPTLATILALGAFTWILGRLRRPSGGTVTHEERTPGTSPALAPVPPGAPGSVARWLPLTERAARQHLTPGGDYTASARLLLAMIWVESSGNPGAVGDGGKAVGLMQLHRSATRDVGHTWPIYDPAKNIDAGAAYLAIQMGNFGTVREALAAYNQGARGFRDDVNGGRAKGLAYADKVLNRAQV